MKKIGIVTLHGYKNYGNKLQNYALKYTLEKLGFEVATTVIKKSRRKKISDYYYLLSNLTIKQIFNKAFNFILPSSKIKNKRNEKIHEQRVSKFKIFSNKYLSEKFYFLDEDEEKIKEISYFVTGSDQVWNPIELEQMDNYFLTFVPKYKRIAYAPSFGLSSLPKTLKNKYKKWIDGLETVSVREDAGAKIIKELTGKTAPVLADPTLLLSKDEWLSIASQADNRPNTPYLLTYFLGGPTSETRKKLEELAKKKNMSIINLGDITETETYKTGPSEFLDYINNASAFFTDSFHGVVFSIIFQTPFIVYERLSSRASMYSRIETILNTFNMKNRESKEFNEDIFSMDFTKSYVILDEEYNKSINYLRKSLME